MTAPGQTPGPGEVFLDHVAWFVPDIERAAAAFQRLGFALTPFVAQLNAAPDGGATQPAGTGNHCAMLEAGYLEVLTAIPGLETPLAEQLRAAVARYTGLHLIAFSVADAGKARTRLKRAGFDPAPAVALRRPVETADGGTAEIEFSVLRVPPGTMAEGRIQLLVQHTPELAWQDRFITRDNAVRALDSVLLCVDDPAEAADRYARFLGRKSAGEGDYCTLRLDRGRLGFATPARCRALLPDAGIPCTPFIAAIGLTSRDLAETAAYLARRGIEAGPDGDGTIRVGALDAMGASLVIHAGEREWPPAP